MSVDSGVRKATSSPIDDDELKSSGSEAKRSRYGSSSDEDDTYSNFNKRFQKKQKKFAKIEASHLRLHETEPTKEASPKLDLSSESEGELGIEEVEEESALTTLLSKGKKFNEEREKNLESDMKRIKELARGGEAELGALPNMIYQDLNSREAENRLRRLKEDRRIAMARRNSLDTVDCVVIDGSGEYMEREYTAYAKPTPRLSGIKVTFLLQDLHLNDTKIEKLDYDEPMRSLVDRISTRWECEQSEIMLTLSTDTVISDLSISPKELKVPLEGIHPISAVYVVSKKGEKAPTRDPNAITIKFQSGQGKPALIDVDKTSPFSEIVDKVAAALKIESIGKLVFDCEKVDLSSTPEELDMDDEDCIDVYAA